MKKLFIIIISVIAFIVYYCAVYSAFYASFSDDVEFHYGKKRMKNRRKKGSLKWWEKLLFLDVRSEVSRWHYTCFCINLLSAVPTLILLICYFISMVEAERIAFFVAGGIFFLSSLPAIYAHWPLYIGNKVRSRKKYRKEHRKRK